MRARSHLVGVPFVLVGIDRSANRQLADLSAGSMIPRPRSVREDAYRVIFGRVIVVIIGRGFVFVGIGVLVGLLANGG